MTNPLDLQGVQPKAASLTNRRFKILYSGLETGTVTMPYLTGLERVAWLQNVEHLVRRDLLEANAHGDWYLTDAGRAAIAARLSQ